MEKYLSKKEEPYLRILSQHLDCKNGGASQIRFFDFTQNSLNHYRQKVARRDFTDFIKTGNGNNGLT